MAESEFFAVVFQYVGQILSLVLTVFGAAVWVDRRNAAKYSVLRLELVGDNEHEGVMTRLEKSLLNAVKDMKRQFGEALRYRDEDIDRLEAEMLRLRGVNHTEKFKRRSRSISYNDNGDEIDNNDK